MRQRATHLHDAAYDVLVVLAASHCRDAGLPIALFQAGDHTLVKETLAWLRSHPNRAIAAKALALTEKLSPGPAGFTGASRWTT